MKVRWTPLILGLILGTAMGLAYGWLIQPVEFVDTSPDSLRDDYQTDYVLMTAEAHSADDNLELAQIRLAALGPKPPETYVADALEFAEENHFSSTDIALLRRLAERLRTLPPAGEIENP